MITVGGAWRLPLLWRDRAPGLRTMPAVWPWGPALWRGYVRGMPSALPVLMLAVISLPLLSAVPEQPEGPFARPLAVVVPFFVIFGLVMGAMLGTVLFNRPKFLVPPHLREQDGAAVELWHALRRRLHS